MAFDPKQCRVLLVGKLVARLEPFLKSKGYARVEAEESGLKSIELLGGASYHLVLLELNLRDVELRDFFLEARGKQRDASFLLLAPPNDAEMVVSALVLGADGYVPLPPDEDELFQVLERHGTAAIQRKSSDPDGQPGVSEKVKALEQELAKARAQIADLEEQNTLFEAETARLNGVLEATKKEVANKSGAQEVPPGHKIVAETELEELEAKATFIEFLESENDEIKKERDSLQAKLRELGLADDVPASAADEFDEPTGAVHIDDEALSRGVPKPMAEEVLVAGDDEDDDDEDELLIVEDDSEEIDLAAVAELAAKEDDGDEAAPAETAPAPATAPKSVEAMGAMPKSAVPKSAAPKTVAALSDDDDDDDIDDDDLAELLEDDSEEIDLAALEAMVAKSTPAPAQAAPSRPAPAAYKPSTPDPVPPPTAADDDDDDDDGDDFEDVNTDALLRLAEGVSSSEAAATPEELEELLAAIDDD